MKEKMKEMKVFYSSKIEEPWCDLQEILSLISSLKEKGIEVQEVDTKEMSEEELKELYLSTAVMPSVKKKYKISSIFGTRGKPGVFFGTKRPSLIVFREDTQTPVDVYPHVADGQRITIADYLSERLAGLEEES